MKVKYSLTFLLGKAYFGCIEIQNIIVHNNELYQNEHVYFIKKKKKGKK